MLKRSRRLRTDRDYSALFRRARQLRGRTLVLRVGAGQRPNDRFGFVVSQKVAKRATVRNRIKRRLRFATRELDLPAHQPIDVAVIAQPSSIDATYQQLRQELHELVTASLHAPIRRRPH